MIKTKITSLRVKTLALMMSLLMMFSVVVLLSSCTDEISSGSASDLDSDIASEQNLGGTVSPSESGRDEGSYRYEILAPTEKLPEYRGEPYVLVNGNMPEFSEREKTMIEPIEEYSDLDRRGRCGVAFANICKDLMPTEKRGSIGMVKPSGWQTARYDDLVDGKYLYNRCHLIGFQLAGENANELNLITGTRYMNVDGMLPWEDLIADYVKQKGNHVVYRVTPIFEGRELVARGVQMEAFSVEDEGEGVCFNVYAFNVQPGIEIDYLTGKSKRVDEVVQAEGDSGEYVLNVSSKKFHEPDCSGARDIKAENRKNYKGSREQLIRKGYEPCGRCNP